jgi:hypothetical protein
LFRFKKMDVVKPIYTAKYWIIGGK